MVGIPQLFSVLAHMRNPSLLSPSIATKISINTGPNAFYGEKYKVEKVTTSFMKVSLHYSLPHSRFSKMTAKSCLELLLLYTIPDARNFLCMVCLPSGLKPELRSVRLTVDIRD